MANFQNELFCSVRFAVRERGIFDMSTTNQQTCNDRIVERRRTVGYTQKQLADAVGVSLTSVQNYEAGRIPNGDVLIRLARVLTCSADWLVTGEGEAARGGEIKFKSARLPSQQMAGSSEAETNSMADLYQKGAQALALMPAYNGKDTLTCFDCELMMVPLVEAKLSAGGGSFETSGDSDRRYAFRMDFLRRKGNASAMVLMRVAGDSMEPKIEHNDVVLIDTSKTELRLGCMYAVAVQDLVYLKMVNAEPGKLILTSANPTYAPLEIDARGDLKNGIRIIGKAVWVGRELD